MFYQEQKTQRQKDSLSAEERLKHQEGINNMNEYRDSLQRAKNESASLESANSTPSLITDSSLINTIGSGTTLDSLLNIADGINSLESSVVETGDNNSTEPKAITQSLELGGEDSKEITLEDETAQLMSDDPWMQRKMAEKAAAEAASLSASL